MVYLEEEYLIFDMKCEYREGAGSARVQMFIRGDATPFSSYTVYARQGLVPDPNSDAKRPRKVNVNKPFTQEQAFEEGKENVRNALRMLLEGGFAEKEHDHTFSTSYC